MYPVDYICDTGWDLDKHLKPQSKQVALVVNTIPKRPTDLYHYDLRIFLHTEPEDIIRGLEYFLFTHWEFFDYVLTFDENLLNSLPNAKKFTIAVPWINQAGFFVPMKKFQVSFIPGNKNNTMGHKLRHVIYRKQSNIKIPKKFIPSLPYDKETRQKVLFDTCKYNIAIENSRHNNYFTEKILDCFLTRTVPIYWGCPNIGEYFNKNGIIQIEKEYDLYSVINNLDAIDYEERELATWDNYDIATKHYLNVGEQGSDSVNNIIEELVKNDSSGT
jgi:hypothetical protein